MRRCAASSVAQPITIPVRGVSTGCTWPLELLMLCMAAPACQFLRPANRAPSAPRAHCVATMNNAPRAGKKRKSGSQELEADRTLYSSFVHAANAVSQLYTAAAQQSKRSEEAGARQALVSAAGIVAQRPPCRLRGPVLRYLGHWEPQAASVACRGPPRLPSPQLPTRAPLLCFLPCRRNGWPSLWSRSMATPPPCRRAC